MVHLKRRPCSIFGWKLKPVWMRPRATISSRRRSAFRARPCKSKSGPLGRLGSLPRPKPFIITTATRKSRYQAGRYWRQTPAAPTRIAPANRALHSDWRCAPGRVLMNSAGFARRGNVSIRYAGEKERRCIVPSRRDRCSIPDRSCDGPDQAGAGESPGRRPPCRNP